MTARRHVQVRKRLDCPALHDVGPLLAITGADINRGATLSRPPKASIWGLVAPTLKTASHVLTLKSLSGRRAGTPWRVPIRLTRAGPGSSAIVGQGGAFRSARIEWERVRLSRLRRS